MKRVRISKSLEWPPKCTSGSCDLRKGCVCGQKRKSAAREYVETVKLIHGDDAVGMSETEKVTEYFRARRPAAATLVSTDTCFTTDDVVKALFSETGREEVDVDLTCGETLSGVAWGAPVPARAPAPAPAPARLSLALGTCTDGRPSLEFWN